MKRYNNLFIQVTDFKNIHSAYLKTRKRKKCVKKILIFNFNLERNLLGIKKELVLQNYKHGKYNEFFVCDSKKRRIKAPCFKDRVIHRSLCNIVEPVFDKSFISDSYACRINKGTHKGVKRLKLFLKDNKNDYCLKCDISKYFDSINHNILNNLIKKKIKDNKTLWLIGEIIKSNNCNSLNRGIPIGNLTSQLFANIYLNELDQFVKHKLKQQKLIRYMDDFLILGNKNDLKIVKKFIGYFLNKKLNLQFNPKKANIFPVLRGVDFLGYVIFKNYILLRKSTVKRFLRKIKVSENIERIIIAWFAYSKHANSYFLRKKLVLFNCKQNKRTVYIKTN